MKRKINKGIIGSRTPEYTLVENPPMDDRLGNKELKSSDSLKQEVEIHNFLYISTYGCHTWCYAHLPEKAKEWNHEYAVCLINDCKEMIDLWKKCPENQLKEYAIENNKCNEDFLKQVNERGKEKIIEEMFGGDEKEFEENYKFAQIKFTPETLLKHQIKYQENTIKEFEKYGEEHVIDFINNSLDNFNIMANPYSFKLFLIKDGKIYRDTCAYRGPAFEENPVFEEHFSDIFRIYDYDAKPCYSLEETLQRCEEYNINWEEKYPNCDILVNKFDRVEKFWKTYPDGIIQFG